VVVRVVTLVLSAATDVGFAPSVVVVLLAAPAVNVTLVVAVAPPAVPVTVFNSALVEARVAVNTPELLVVPVLGLNVLLEPLLLKLTACPATRLPCTSATVNVRSVVLVPSAVTDVGLAASVEVLLRGVPPTNVTFVLTLTIPIVAVTFFVSAVIEASVVVNTPEPFVVPESWLNVLLEPVLLKDTACPAAILPWASLAVRVSVVVLDPSAVTEVGLATSVVVFVDAAPAVNVTLAFLTTKPAVAVTVFASAVVDASVAVKTPDAFVVPESGESTSFDPVLDTDTACPATGFP
jgi:hypothetical protein